MNRTPFYFSVIILFTFVALISGCDMNTLETCEEDEICEGKTVMACCNDMECYYTYNGKKYGDDPDSLAQLARDLGCTFSGMANYDTEIETLVLQLNALRELAKSNISKTK